MTISKGISSKVLKLGLYCFYLFLIVFILLEILLRIYDPFRFRIKADRIILPVNQTQIIRNSINPKLDPTIINTRNSLGFRGPDTPADFSNCLSIITIGGSTTECHFLNDQKTWPYTLGELLKNDFDKVWLNNAGMDGHSTFGHQVMLDDYVVKLKPKVILFLTGVNDIENNGPSFFDKLNIRGAFPDFLHYLYNQSEVINVVVNLIRGARAQKFNNTTQLLRSPGKEGTLLLSDGKRKERLLHQQKYLPGYGERLTKLIKTCEQNNILPVFVTQPTLYGPDTDSVTHVNLATAKIGEEMNGQLLSDILELYNNKIKQVCKLNSVPLIDLAQMMPRNSLYYYDQTHYTNEGAEYVARITEHRLKEILDAKYPAYRLQSN